MKICIRCQSVLPPCAFYLDPRTPDGLRGTCKKCRHSQELLRIEKNPQKEADYQRRYREVNREKRRLQNQKWAAKNKGRRKDLLLRWNYGITLERFSEMMLEQSGRCRICRGRMKTPNIDHCHKTGKVRGLLCGRCNTALGGFQDSTKLLRAAICYLDSQLTNNTKTRKNQNK